MNEPWMPSDEEIDAAALSANPFEYEGTDELRALIRTTVEKALAEQKVEWENQIALERKKLASDPVYAEKAVIFELRRESAEQEARHRREVLKARIESLDHLFESGYISCATTAGVVAKNYIDTLRAELAALGST